MIKQLISRGERGATLVESLMAIALLGGVVVTLVLTMSGGAMAVNQSDLQATAQELARTQLEYTKSYTYDPSAVTYPTVSAPAGWSIAVGVSAVPGATNTIQKITATVSHAGTTILSVQDYKGER